MKVTKKAKPVKIIYKEASHIYTIYTCPTCKTTIEGDNIGRTVEIFRCRECGQRLKVIRTENERAKGL